MRYRYFYRFFYTVLLNIFFKTAVAQSIVCPENIDFETGGFTNWECRTGRVFSDGTNNQITWDGFLQTNGRHSLISSLSTAIDMYGGFPVVCPNGSNYCVKLGNNQTGSEAEGIFYTYNIPASITSFSLVYQYAVVFEDPGHPAIDQPRFVARIMDVTDNRQISCVSFDFTASASLPGFTRSPISPTVWYKSWTPITLNLGSYAGKTIRLEFITSDCTRGGHFGYAYVDVNSSCAGAITGASVCQGDTEVSLVAPFGFQSYEWYTDNSFSQLLDTSQTLYLSPVPVISTTFPVIVTPFPGYGCRDTLFATIKNGSVPPVSFTINKDTQCITGNAFQFTNTSPPGNGEVLNYMWRFGDGDSSKFQSVQKSFLNTGNYTAKLILSSSRNCSDSLEKTIALVPNGIPEFTWDSICAYRSAQFTNLSFENGAQTTKYKWDFNNGIISNVKDPPPVVFNSGGIFDVSLELVALGCETNPVSVIKPVFVNAPPPSSHYNDITLAEGYSTYLGARHGSGNSYSWQPQVQLNNYYSRTPLFTAVNDVTYYISIVDKNDCMTIDTLNVLVLKKPGSYLPSAFTPNGDGLNDDVRPFLVGMKKLLKFSVYNRYGNLIYFTRRDTDAWDGTYQGKALESAVYVWMLEFIDNNDKKIIQKGTITLIR